MRDDWKIYIEKNCMKFIDNLTKGREFQIIKLASSKSFTAKFMELRTWIDIYYSSQSFHLPKFYYNVKPISHINDNDSTWFLT